MSKHITQFKLVTTLIEMLKLVKACLILLKINIDLYINNMISNYFLGLTFYIGHKNKIQFFVNYKVFEHYMKKKIC